MAAFAKSSFRRTPSRGSKLIKTQSAPIPKLQPAEFAGVSAITSNLSSPTYGSPAYSAGFSITGAGTLSLSGSNTFSGAVSIGFGSLTLSGAGLSLGNAELTTRGSISLGTGGMLFVGSGSDLLHLNPPAVTPNTSPETPSSNLVGQPGFNLSTGAVMTAAGSLTLASPRINPGGLLGFYGGDGSSLNLSLGSTLLLSPGLGSPSTLPSLDLSGQMAIGTFPFVVNNLGGVDFRVTGLPGSLMTILPAGSALTLTGTSYSVAPIGEGASAVPEPATAGLAAVGLLVIAIRQKRRRA